MLFAWRPALAPIVPVASPGFDPGLVRRGAELAALGDCNTCHTAPQGKTFAGGRPLETPFGTIYATNITPDPQTGIGLWSEAAFRRAMREGVDRQGRHLYPAFPYDHFTLISDDDDKALYAYLMTRQPVHAETPRNTLPFPINIRLILAGWNLLYLHKGPYRPDPSHDQLWNRGAYLVEGVGHCGACHTPRNALGAEERDKAFAGGEAEGWHAFSINQSSQAPVAWDAQSLQAYLANGWHGLHGVARGPMAPVVGNLSDLPAEDIRAIAVYIAALMKSGAAPPAPEEATPMAANADSKPGSRPQSAGSQGVASVAATDDAGERIYAAACATCHESGRPVPYGGIHLSLSTAVTGESPRNLINIVLAGLPATDGTKAPIMPNFGGVLSDAEVADLARYLRSMAGKPDWDDLESRIKAARGALSGPAASVAVSK